MSVSLEGAAAALAALCGIAPKRGIVLGDRGGQPLVLSAGEGRIDITYNGGGFVMSDRAGIEDVKKLGQAMASVDLFTGLSVDGHTRMAAGMLMRAHDLLVRDGKGIWLNYAVERVYEMGALAGSFGIDVSREDDAACVDERCRR